MSTKEVINKWFEVWTKGDFEDIPVTNDFKHTSPYGIIEGKERYLSIVRDNKDKFLDNHFTIHDTIYSGNRGCTRYTIDNPSFSMEVSEWFYVREGQLAEVVAYYNIESEISDERKLTNFN